MAKVKIHQITDISDYGASLNRFIESYLQSVEHVHRDFRIKTDSSEGAAISAFFQKLSQIQEQVFVQFPASLTRGSSAFIDYYDSLTGLGFDKEVWTSDDGKTMVVSKLTGEQYDKVSEVKDSLQAKLDVATDLLGLEPVDLTPTMTGAENSLSSASDHRSKTHDGISIAYDTFLKTLSSTESELSAYVGILANAQFVTHVPVTSVLSAISSGSLRSDNMSQLDLIQNKTEATAYAAYLREDYATFFEQNPDEIKAELYDVVTVGLNEVLLSGDEKKVNTFLSRLSHGLNAMIMGDYDYHMKHLAKIEASGERYSSVAFSSALLLHANGKSETDAYKQLHRSLESNHHLRLLWRSLTVTGLRGQNINIYEEDHRKAGGWDLIQKNKITELQLTENGFSYEVSWKRYIAIPDNTIKGGYREGDLVSQSDETTSGLFTMESFENGELLSNLKQEEITEIKLANHQLPSQLVGDLLSSAVGAKNPILGLLVGTLIEVGNEDPEGDYQMFYGKKGADALGVWAEVKDNKTASLISDNLNSVLEHYGTYRENLEKIDKHNRELFADYLGYGGGEISVISNEKSSLESAGRGGILSPESITKSVEIDPYNVEAYRRYQQFEDGIKTQLLNRGNSSFEEVKENYEHRENIYKVFQYLEEGSSSGYSLHDFDFEAFEKVIDILEEEGISLPWEGNYE